MTTIGYARVSTLDQDLELQHAALKAAGCSVIRSEKRSGTSTEGRAELRTVMDFVQAGDVLTVTRIDRLARSIGDLQDIVRELRAKGVALKATEQPIDTTTAAGKAFLDMLGVFAEFETNLRKERQLEGIAAAKAKGVYKGRPPSIEGGKVAALKAEGSARLRLPSGSAWVARQSIDISPEGPSRHARFLQVHRTAADVRSIVSRSVSGETCGETSRAETSFFPSPTNSHFSLVSL